MTVYSTKREKETRGVISRTINSREYKRQYVLLPVKQLLFYYTSCTRVSFRIVLHLRLHKLADAQLSHIIFYFSILYNLNLYSIYLTLKTPVVYNPIYSRVRNTNPVKPVYID